jgi:pimeloyl-ACP methyl ester carboxylesterase
MTADVLLLGAAGNSGRLIDISVTRMVDDTVALLELLHDRFGGKTLVAGFSFGATFAAYAAARRPELVAALIATGMDIDLPLAEDDAYDFALGAARQRGHRRAIRQLEAIGPPPHTTMRQFSTRARWAANFGGVAANANFSSLLRALLVSLVRSPDYSPAAVVRTLRGIGASQAVPSKELVWFESSAHSPHLEEPAKFRDLFMNVRASQFAST